MSCTRSHSSKAFLFEILDGFLGFVASHALGEHRSQRLGAHHNGDVGAETLDIVAAAFLPVPDFVESCGEDAFVLASLVALTFCDPDGLNVASDLLFAEA